MPTEDAYSSGHLVLSHLGLANALLLRPLTHKHTLHSLIWLLPEFDITEYRFPWGICKGCGMLTGDAYSFGHLVLYNFGLACFLILRPTPPELVLSPDLWVSNTPRYFCFTFTCLSCIKTVTLLKTFKAAIYIYRLLNWHPYSLKPSEMTLWSMILWLHKGTLC